MRPQLTMLLAAGFVAAAPLAYAEGDENQNTWSGSVSLGIRYVDQKGNDPSKLYEYRDLGEPSSLYGGFEFRGRSDTGYFNLYGENFGTDDQYVDMRAGAFGVYKYRLYSKDMVHNLGAGAGALSPYNGIGSDYLTATMPNANVSTWNQFNQAYVRRDRGGFAEWQRTSPVYIRFDANEVQRTGVNVFSGANGTSPGNGFTNLPVPIDYTTHNFSGEIGFAGERSHLAVNLTYSTFDNGFNTLRWSNGFFGGVDTTVLPPDNQMLRLAVNGNMRQLFWNSTIAARVVVSQLESSTAIQPQMLAAGGTFAASNATPSNFNGDITRTNVQLSWTAHPVDALDTRVYYDYQEQKNDSTQMSFPGTTLTGGTCGSATNPNCEPELYHYKKNKLGAEGTFRVTRANKLGGGLEWLGTEQERVDFPKSDTSRVWVEWKNTSLESVGGRIKYQYLTRSSDFNADIAQFTGNPMDFYVRRFDFANVDQNSLKFVLDVNPVALLDLGFEITYKDNNYKDTILGRTSDNRQEYYASVAYGDPNSIRGMVFGDYENTKYESSHRVGTGNPDPSTPPVAGTYNWSATNKDEAWELGAGLDWRTSPRLKWQGSVIFAKTNGTTDFTAQIGNPLPIPNVDNTKRTSFNVKAVFDYDRNWQLTGGYAYEKYEYDDIGYTGSRYVTGATNQAGVVTGQYSFQPYTANIVYGMAKYKF